MSQSASSRESETWQFRGNVNVGLSSDASRIRDDFRNAVRYWQLPLSNRSVPHEPSFRDRFRELAERWSRETRDTSSLTRMVLHPAYQQIIGLGQAAVPLLLEELRDRPDHWFWALASITGENPVRDSDAGDSEAMATAWLEWGREHGHI